MHIQVIPAVKVSASERKRTENILKMKRKKERRQRSQKCIQEKQKTSE